MLGFPYESGLDRNLSRRKVQDTVDAVTVDDFFSDGSMASNVANGFSVGDIGDGEIQGGMLADALITTEKLANLSVDTTKLANLAVEASKLANSSVDATKIANLAVGSAAIAALAVGTAHIANGAIINAKIGDAQITNAKIADATIDNAKIANLSADKINAGELVGRTVKANGGSGSDVEISNGGYISFKYGGVQKAILICTSGGNVGFNAEDHISIRAGDSLDVKINEDGGSDWFTIFSNGEIISYLDADGNWHSDGNYY